MNIGGARVTERAATRPAICAIVVTYHPDADVRENLCAIMRECDTVVVVDNGSAPDALARIATVAGTNILKLGTNCGIATALNQGTAWARARGFAWCVAFDQDSRPLHGMIAAMWATHLRFPQAAIVGPTIREEAADPGGYRWVVRHPHASWFFRRVACGAEDLHDVTMLISSGALFELDTWERVGGFNDGLFIDYVDVDYCLKVLRGGRSIAVSASAVLYHRLGNRRIVRVFGREFRPMGHAPFRHYYMARNRCATWHRHARAMPHWAMFDLAFAIFNTTRALSFESERWAKLRMLVRGTWDGLRGQTGPLRATNTKSVH